MTVAVTATVHLRAIQSLFSCVFEDGSTLTQRWCMDESLFCFVFLCRYMYTESIYDTARSILL